MQAFQVALTSALAAHPEAILSEWGHLGLHTIYFLTQTSSNKGLDKISITLSCMTYHNSGLKLLFATSTTPP